MCHPSESVKLTYCFELINRKNTDIVYEKRHLFKERYSKKLFIAVKNILKARGVGVSKYNTFPLDSTDAAEFNQLIRSRITEVDLAELKEKIISIGELDSLAKQGAEVVTVESESESRCFTAEVFMGLVKNRVVRKEEWPLQQQYLDIYEENISKGEKATIDVTAEFMLAHGRVGGNKSLAPRDWYRACFLNEVGEEAWCERTIISDWVSEEYNELSKIYRGGNKSSHTVPPPPNASVHKRQGDTLLHKLIRDSRDPDEIESILKTYGERITLEDFNRKNDSSLTPLELAKALNNSEGFLEKITDAMTRYAYAKRARVIDSALYIGQYEDAFDWAGRDPAVFAEAVLKRGEKFVIETVINWVENGQLHRKPIEESKIREILSRLKAQPKITGTPTSSEDGLSYDDIRHNLGMADEKIEFIDLTEGIPPDWQSHQNWKGNTAIVVLKQEINGEMIYHAVSIAKMANELGGYDVVIIDPLSNKSEYKDQLEALAKSISQGNNRCQGVVYANLETPTADVCADLSMILARQIGKNLGTGASLKDVCLRQVNELDKDMYPHGHPVIESFTTGKKDNEQGLPPAPAVPSGDSALQQQQEKQPVEVTPVQLNPSSQDQRAQSSQPQPSVFAKMGAAYAITEAATNTGDKPQR